jgi:hypothetical protein
MAHGRPKIGDIYFAQSISVHHLLLLTSMLSVYLWNSPSINFWFPEPVFMKFGMYNMAFQPMSTAYFIFFAISLCVCMCIPLPLPSKGKVIHIRFLCDPCHERIIGYYFFPEFLAFYTWGGIRLSPIGTSATHRPILPAPNYVSMMMMMSVE